MQTDIDIFSQTLTAGSYRCQRNDMALFDWCSQSDATQAKFFDDSGILRIGAMNTQSTGSYMLTITNSQTSQSCTFTLVIADTTRPTCTLMSSHYVHTLPASGLLEIQPNFSPTQVSDTHRCSQTGDTSVLDLCTKPYSDFATDVQKTAYFSASEGKLTIGYLIVPGLATGSY